jgi:Type IV secretion-system coupling protein DNA-binding domain/TraM recognition site of TraD and TraG
MPDAEGFMSGEAPAPSLTERLTQQFYDWEVRGRGWYLYDHPVALEPPFRPFLFHTLPPAPVVDDARKPTFWSTLIDTLRVKAAGASSSPQLPESVTDSDLLVDPSAAPPRAHGSLVTLRVTLPPGIVINRQTTEQFLAAMTYCRSPLSFEIVGLPEEIAMQIACGEDDVPQLREQLKAYFPEAIVTDSPDFLEMTWDETATKETVIVELGLSQEFMRPLCVYDRFEPDPLIGIVGALQDVREGEVGLLQVLFERTRSPWAESILRSVTDGEGRSFFADAPEMVAFAKEKIRRPLFAAVIRVAARSRLQSRAWQIAKMVNGALAQFSATMSNDLIPLTNEGYDEDVHVKNVLRRETYRSGMLLNSHELISLVHLPSNSVRSEKLTREARKTRAAPATVLGHRLILGENQHAGRTAVVTLHPAQRTRHTYVIGASGTGKSTLLLNLIIQDIAQSQGIAVLDPHGDLVDHILSHVPEERFDDVVLLDPSDEAYPVGFNILSAHSEVEKNLLASDLVSVFRRLSTSWGDQMTSVLGNAILAFLESDRGGTLADLRRFLVEPDYRRAFLDTVRDGEVVYYWQKEFPMLVGKPQAPLLTRLDTFLRPRLIRAMVGQRENRLDFGAIMNEGKIFLAKLAQGAIGEENAYLLGTLLVSKFHQIAMSRQDVREGERRDFYLYIDEFQNFITPSMASILSGARKYHLGLILAHQELRQLMSRDEEVANAVIANPATRVCFRLGDFDAKKLADGFSSFDARDLQNLGVGEAICRVERAEHDFNLKTLPLPEVDSATAMHRRERLVALSRERFGRKREEVEVAMQRSQPEPSPKAITEPEAEKAPRVTKPSPLPMRGKATESFPVEREVSHTEPEPVSAGRGGGQHKYLQQLIKRWAESKGYRAAIEKQILNGLGSVDVALEGKTHSIACEISVASTSEQELGNIRKCLAAGFTHVALISSEKKTLDKLTTDIHPKLSQDESKRVAFFTPAELFDFVETLDVKTAAKEETVRGYRVKVQYRPVAEEEKKSRKQAISEVIIKAFRRLKQH